MDLCRLAIRRMLQDPLSELYTDISLKDDPLFLKRMITIDSDKKMIYVADMSNRLKNDKEFIIALMRINPEFYIYVSDIFKNDIDVVNMTISHNGNMFQHLPQKIKNMKDIILLAVTTNYAAIKYIPDIYIKYPDIFESLLRNNHMVFRYIDKNYTKHLHNIQYCVDLNGLILSQLYNPPDYIIHRAIEQNYKSFQYAPLHIKANKSIVLDIVQKNGLFIEYATKFIRHDKDVVYAAVRQNGYAMILLKKTYKDDKELAMIALQNKYYINTIFSHLSPRLKEDNEIKLKGQGLYIVEKKLAWAKKFSEDINDDIMSIVSNMITQYVVDQIKD